MGSMRQEIETWIVALQHYDANEFEEAIEAFMPIVETSKILFNCGVIRATLGEHQEAVAYYQQAVAFDNFLAIAYFQQGVSNFLLGDFEEALANFNDALLYLRGNAYIDYEQLGLKYKLYACEAIFNRGLCYIYLQQTQLGMADLKVAAREKMTASHDVIEEAIKENADGYTVFSIPVGLVFRPSEAKVRNIRQRDYLGGPRLVATKDTSATNVHKGNISAEQWARDDRPADQLSYAATNLVRPGLSSRTRQQSEPPVQRSMFPPTPPPESEKPLLFRTSQMSTSSQQQREQPQHRQHQRRASPDRVPGDKRSRSLNRRAPEPLELGVAAFDRPKLPVETSVQEQPRRGTQRSASERPSSRSHDKYYYHDRRSHVSERSSQRRQASEKFFGAVDHDGQQEHVAAQLHQQLQSQPQQNQRPRNSSRSSANHPLSARSQRPELIEERVEEEESQDDHYQARLTGNTIATSMSAGILRSPEVREDEQRPKSSRKHSDMRSPRSRYHVHSSSLRVQKVRCKVHFGEDTRYMILPTNASFPDFLEQIVRKFAARTPIVVKIRDEEGDMITMADQDDLDMALTSSLEAAAKERHEMAKIEVWVQAA